MKKDKLVLLSVILLGLIGGREAAAQQTNPSRILTPTVTASPTPQSTPNLSKNLELAVQQGGVPREKREQAYAKLLEAQRYLWGMSRVRTQNGIATGARTAKQALQKAVELDPTLSEAYTALAEITLSTPPNDIDEAIMLANIAAKINPDNFGAHRILARVYTIKSRLNNGTLEPAAAQRAITEWKEIARMDPRNAEAWAFLSAFYEKTNQSNDRIDALNKWLSAAAPLETRFYRTIMGAQENLTPESASPKLGLALITAGRTGEAVEILSRAVADDPENAEAIDLLRQALENGGGSNAVTIESLQQAAFANPANVNLVTLLADVQSKNGKTGDAVKTLKNTLSTIGSTDKNASANLQVVLGDVYTQAKQGNEAISAYEDALKTFGITNLPLTNDDEREFATRVFEKMINTYKTTGRINEARATIERARLLIGKQDLFADKQLVSLLRETGKKNEALDTIRALRKEYPEDYSLMRLEASVLTELGKVDDGVAVIRTLVDKKSAVPSPYYDDFSNYIFMSSLYNQAKRPKEAITTAQKAYTVANSEEKKQIASIVLATAQQQSGDYQSAEKGLRDILKKTPGNPIALNNLGYFLLERGSNLEEAYNLIEQAVKIDPTNPSYLDSLGWANYKLGRLDESEKYLKQAISYNPNSVAAHEHLGDVYQKQGKADLAKSSWEKALSLASNDEISLRLKSKIAKK